jgi:hypothetical protein
MTERAEGFWWVRWAKQGLDDPPEVAEVVAWAEHARRLSIGATPAGELPSMVHTRRGWTSVDACGLEWGPYLGKEPGDIFERVADWIRDHADDAALTSERSHDAGGFNIEVDHLDAGKLAAAVERLAELRSDGERADSLIANLKTIARAHDEHIVAQGREPLCEWPDDEP